MAARDTESYRGCTRSVQGDTEGADREADNVPDTKARDDADVEVATRKEGRAMLDKAAHTVLNISGDEFLARWDAGEYEDRDDPSITRVAMLIPFAR